MVSEGKYIYCIIEENKDRSLDYIGIKNQEVILVHYKDIAAVVSNAPIINFDRLDKKKLTEEVSRHQRVNEMVMQDYDVVPMAFGIIAESEKELVWILEKAYLQLKTALKGLAGKVEFAVQIFWDEEKALTALANTDSEIKKLREEARSPIKGIVAKIRLGKLIFETLENQRKEYVEKVENSLKECSLDSRPGKLLDKTMIGNISFLVERQAESEFDRKMQELGQKYGDDLRFKYVGPMPSYSFVNINLGLGNFEVVDGARKLLGLGEEASFEEIKKTYYALSHQYHPDKYGGHSETGEEIKKIIEAYSILENYCQSCDEFMGKVVGRKYSFRKEDVKDALIIK